MVLVELLQWINNPANRRPDTEETMVIGASMGGQVSRFALAWMEQQGLCHNSKLWVSFDSPHRGANISIGIQHMFDRLQGVWVGSGAAEDAVQNKLLREATMQMVLFHFNLDARPYRTAWQRWQNSTGSYPSLLRKVAVANGSGQAVAQPGMYPGMELLSTNPFASVFIAGPNYAYALPGMSSLGHDNVVFRYHKPYTFHDNWRYSYCDPTWSYFDQAPGSFRRTSAEAEEQSSGNLSAAYPSQTFMTTISALDIQDAGSYNSPNLSYNVQNQVRPDRPDRAKYAFDAYFSADNVNEPHVQITNAQGSTQNKPSYYSDNSAWIRNELRESAHLMPGILTGIYNFGNPYRHLLPSVQINQGGQLFINKENLPVSGGTAATQAPPAPGSFEVYTPNCNAVVRVNAGGLLTVGGDNAHPATLQISANSLLDIEASGQVTVSAGSTLRVVAGGTLVVHQGGTLQGQVEIADGAYVCTESGANIGAFPAFNVGRAATYGINPPLLTDPSLAYLNLNAVSCAQPGGLQVYITNYTTTSQCTSNSGRPNYAQWTATVQGSGSPYTYTWYLDPTASGNNYQPVPASSTVVSAGNTSTLGLCMSGYSYYLLVKVVVTNSLGQQVSDSYYGLPQMLLYPNPADAYADVTNSEESDAATTARGTEAAGSASPLDVTVYNGQGRVVFTAADVAAGAVRLPTSTWPNGLYQVRTRQGQTVQTRPLSVQH